MIATKNVQSFIGGKFRDSRSEKTDPIPNPATGETIASLPYSTRDEINEAIAAAKKAFPGWSETPVPERAQVMFRFKALFDQHIDELSAIVTQENGKTLDESRGEVKRAIEVIDFACGAPTLMMGQNLDQIAKGIDEELTRFPVGVVAGITPFNFPNMVPMWMIPVAIGTRHTVVLKPSQLTPLSAMRIAELLQEAGLPEGVFNVVHGANDAVNQLLTHPDVSAISFVGSATVAAYIYGAQREGAQLVSDGRSVELKDGFFLGPTIFDRVTPNMKIWKEELFGPVLSVMRASDIDEALNLLNASTYGNMASIFTGSGKYAREFKRRAQAGMLGVNIGVAAPMAFFPFTGWKNSFFGDLHATGQASIPFYTRHNAVTPRRL